MPIRMPAIRAWFPLAALLIWLPGPRRQADPALAQLTQGNEFYNQAIKFFEAKNYTAGNAARAKGIASFQKAIELNPKLFAAYRNLGDLYRRNTSSTNDFQRAADAYKKALEIKPDAETANRLGISYTALGKTADAIAASEQAIRLDPTVATYQYNLGFKYAEVLNLDGARKVQERLQTMDQALAQQLLDRIRKISGEASLIGRPTTYSNPKLELVLIPPGSFEMGGWTSGGKMIIPGRKVTIKSGFHMGKYPVTQAQWQAVMGDNPSFFKNCGGNCPVEQVSWNDAQAFITRLNQLKDGFRYRLPSEAEWEYAYRGGTQTLTYAEGDIGWHPNNSSSKTHPVGEKPANPFGLYDMGGHVKEWCLDWYAPKGSATGASPVTEGDEPMYRVLRGTSFYAMSSSGVTTRNKSRIDEISRNNGFRVVAEKVR